MKSLPKKATERGSAYDRCLVALAHRDTTAAVATLDAIDPPALRAIAQDQISIVEDLEQRLRRGENAGIDPPLIARLVGGVRVTYTRLLRAALPLVPRLPATATTTCTATDIAALPTDASQRGEPPTGQRVNARPIDESVSPQSLANAEAELRAKIAPITLDRQLGLRGDAIRQLCAIAVRSWMRRTNRFGLDLLRVNRTEICTTAICLREYLAGNAAPIPLNEIASALAVRESHVVTVTAALRQYLLRGSGWALTYDRKTGALLTPAGT